MSRVSVSCRVRGVNGKSIQNINTKNNESDDITGIIEIIGLNKLSVRSISQSERDSNTPNGLVFELDHIFDEKCSQEKLFTELVQPILDDVLKGFNATIFTYGQTGSGKTYCMEGKMNGDSAARGIVPRTIDHLFGFINEAFPPCADAGNSCEVRLSVMQIYQEKLMDLLLSSSSARDSNQLRIREYISGHEIQVSSTGGKSAAHAAALASVRESGNSIWVEGLTEVRVNSPREFEVLMGNASKKRSVGSHNMNSESSRSHLITILTVIQTKKQTLGMIDSKVSGTSALDKQHNRMNVNKLYSKVYLVDLAGSEMVRVL